MDSRIAIGVATSFSCSLEMLFQLADDLATAEDVTQLASYRAFRQLSALQFPQLAQISEDLSSRKPDQVPCTVVPVSYMNPARKAHLRSDG